MEWHNINVNARYEVKLLTRSGLFRTFSLLAIVGISVALLMNNTSMINRWEGSWAASALTSLIPFTATYYYTVAQAVILIFLAGTFLKKGQKLDTTEVLMVRPMSNSDYILGKVLGIAQVFVGINIIILLIAGFLNAFVNQSPFSIIPYFFYLLTISIPTLVFMLGLSFISVNIFKNQAVTFIILLGVVGIDVFYLTDKWYGVLDLTGCAIPAIFSDLTGMADMSSFIMQRLCYLILGVGLLLLTIAFVDRLPERKSSKRAQLYLGMVVCLLGVMIGVVYVSYNNAQTHVRNKYIATFKEYAYQPTLNTIENSITVSTGHNHLDGQATMTIINNNPSEAPQITLYLNPGLQITEISEGSKSLEFERDNQVALINRPMLANDTVVLNVKYNGHIDERVCYADVVQDWIDSTKSESIQHYGKHYAYLENKCVLLTPESIWYPVTIAPSNPLAKYHISRDFTKYTLKVENRKNREIVSQGFPIVDSVYTTFNNLYDLSGISLAIADYEKRSINVDNIDYEVYNFRGNDFFSKHFTHIQDTLPALIRDIMGDQESRFGVAYPFDKLAFIETPVHFTSYPRTWKGNAEFIQPELVFVPERGVTLNMDFDAEATRIKEWSSRSQSLPDEETMESQLFNNSFVRIFTSETSRQRRNWEQQSVNMHSIAPLFSNFTRYIYSYEYPIFDIALTTLQTLTSTSTQARFWEGIVNNRQRANQYLEDYSFQYATRDTTINPEIFYELLKLKTAQLRMFILSNITKSEFENFLDDFFFEHEFKRSNATDFIEEFKADFGVDLTPFLDDWYTKVVSPEIMTADVYASKAEFDDATQYIVEFKLYNPSQSDAIITAQIGTGGGGGGNRGGGFGSNNEDNTYYYNVPAGTAWAGRILTEDQPSNLVLNYNIAKNLPTTNTISFSKIDMETDDTTHGFVQIPVEDFSTTMSGEYIIDNESPNFRLISSNDKTKLQEMLNRTETTDKYNNMQFWHAPSKWTLTAADYMYGDVAKSAYYKRKGSGANGAVWEFNVEEPGIYNIEIWVCSSNNFGHRRSRGAQEQYYVVANDEWTENMAMNWNRNESGWYTLGTFDLPKGVTTVTLSDKTERQFVIADAIKFVKDERKSDSGSNSNRQIYNEL